MVCRLTRQCSRQTRAVEGSRACGPPSGARDHRFVRGRLQLISISLRGRTDILFHQARDPMAFDERLAAAFEHT